MGVALVKNNAYSKLAGSLTATATTLSVAAGQGARFPTIASGTGDFFFVSIIDLSNNIEVVKVIATATDVFTIARGQDGTTARTFVTNDRIELRPTAALFNDKLSLGGGTLLGHVEAIAGASGSQVPRVSEVVKKAGDQMSGPLIVPELRGPSNEILIPTGHKLKGQSNGLITQPGMIINTLYKQVDTVNSWSAGVNTTVDIDVFTFSITPKYADSKILVSIDLVGECASHDMVFRLTRNGIPIANNSTVPLQPWVGWKTGMYDSDTASTPRNFYMTYMDSPSTTSACEYKLQVIGSSANAITFYLNRAVNGAAVGQSSYEISTSSIMLQEVAQ
jgi:hypothetical protein